MHHGGMIDALAPGFLIAFPHLVDPNFKQSVVLLLEQNEDGAMGLVINQESPMLVRELCSDHQIDFQGQERKRVRCGGPVQPDQGLVLYGDGHTDPDGQRIHADLSVSASRGTLSRLCGLETGRFQCYSGYSGWGPDQLEQELTAGAWLHTKVDPAMILDRSPDEVWLGCLTAMGIDPAALVPGGGQQA